MAVKFQILPRKNLVYVTYSGHIDLNESAQSFAQYCQHPDYHPSQRMLIDLSRVTSFEQNYTRILEMQAQKADVMVGKAPETFLIYFATTPLSQQIARFLLNTWEQVGAVIATLQTDETHTLQILGLTETSFKELLQPVAET